MVAAEQSRPATLYLFPTETEPADSAVALFDLPDTGGELGAHFARDRQVEIPGFHAVGKHELQFVARSKLLVEFSELGATDIVFEAGIAIAEMHAARIRGPQLVAIEPHADGIFGLVLDRPGFVADLDRERVPVGKLFESEIFLFRTARYAANGRALVGRSAEGFPASAFDEYGRFGVNARERKAGSKRTG